MIDYDTVNEINLENWKQFEWEIETKNRILRMTNESRKQAEWNKYFMRTQPDDSYLFGNVY